MDTTTEHDQSVPTLLRQLRDEIVELFRKELALARTEANEKVSLAAKNAIFLVAGGLIAFTGTGLILAACSVLVAMGLQAAGASVMTSAWAGPGIVGLIVAALGAAFVMKGIKTFKDSSLRPDRTIRSIKEDKQWTQARIHA